MNRLIGLQMKLCSNVIVNGVGVGFRKPLPTTNKLTTTTTTTTTTTRPQKYSQLLLN